MFLAQRRWISRERGRRTEHAQVVKSTKENFVVAVLHGIHQKGVRHSMSGRRTLLMWSSFERGHLSDRGPCRAMPKWIYCKRGKKIQLFVSSSWWDRKSRLSLEFVGVSVVFFFLFLKLEMDAGAREAAPGRETESRKKLVCKRA